MTWTRGGDQQLRSQWSILANPTAMMVVSDQELNSQWYVLANPMVMIDAS